MSDILIRNNDTRQGRKYMFIDLHIHEKTFSLDSKISLQDIVNAAKERGLDAVCITDHDHLGIREEAHRFSKEIGYPIFVGVEYYSLDGDLVTFGVNSIPDTRIPAQEYINYVTSQGGVCYSAHPYRNNKRGLENKLATITGLVGAEVLNANTCREENNQAIEMAQKLGMQQIGASDAHFYDRVGFYATYFPQQIKSEEDLINALKEGKCKAAYWTPNGYQILHGNL